MIDIHSHILPNLDDGSGSLEQSIEMAKTAANSGTTLLYATPHHANGMYWNDAQTVTNAVAKLNYELQLRAIPLQVKPGSEIRVYKNLLDDLDNGIILSLDHSRYILIEFPPRGIPEQIKELIHELKVMGKVAVLAHPERNLAIARNPQKLVDLVELGVLCQVTAGSISGAFGSKIRRFASKLCEANLVHFVGSDAHNTSTRSCQLAEAYHTVSTQLGQRFSEYYQQNARELAANNEITLWKPVRSKLTFLSKWVTFH